MKNITFGTLVKVLIAFTWLITIVGFIICWTSYYDGFLLNPNTATFGAGFIFFGSLLRIIILTFEWLSAMKLFWGYIEFGLMIVGLIVTSVFLFNQEVILWVAIISVALISLIGFGFEFIYRNADRTVKKCG
jgi:hypothetical protein